MPAGLNDANATAAAEAICTKLGLTDQVSKDLTIEVYKTLYTHLKADILITITALSIVTTGSAATQSGPAAPIPLAPA